MFRIFIWFLLLSVSGTLLSQQRFVVQGAHDQSISYAGLDKQRGILISYGYTDKTLKFWDDATGLLLRTVDLENYVSHLEVNEREGKTYVLSSNEILVYSNDNFEQIANYPLGRIYAIAYMETNRYQGLTLFAQDTQGAQVLYALDEITGNFNAGNIPAFIGEGSINHYTFSKGGSRIFIQTEYLETYIYNFEKEEYIELRGNYVGMLHNGDVIKAEYNKSQQQATYARMDPITKEIIWQQTVSLGKVYGEAIPYRGDLEISPSGNELWVAPGEGSITEINAKDGTIQRRFESAVFKGEMLVTENHVYAQSTESASLVKYRKGTEKPILKYGNAIRSPDEVLAYVGNNELELMLSSQYGVKTYSILANSMVTKFTRYQTNYRDDYSAGKMIVDQQSNKVYSVTGTTDPIKVFERGKPESFSNLIENFKDISQYDYSPNTHLLVTLSNSGMRIINTEDASEVYTKIMGTDISAFNHSLSIAPFGNQVAYLTSEFYGDNVNYETLHYFDFVARKDLWTKEGRYYGLFHLNGGKELLAVNATQDRIEIIDAQTGELKRQIPLNFGKILMNTELSPNEQYLLFTGYLKGAFVFDITSGEQISSSAKKNDFGFFKGTFVNNSVVAMSASSAVKFIDVLTMKELLRLYVFEDDNWIAYTPEGQFDGSQNAWDKVAFIKGRKAIPLESVFDQFYTPRLLYQVVAEKGFKSNFSIENIKEPPTVRLEFSQNSRNLYVEDDSSTKEITTQNGVGKIDLTGDAKGGEIKELRLYHNGKLVGNNTRNLFVEDDPSANSNTKEFEISLIEGANDFIAIALNEEGTESTPEKLTVMYTPQEGLLKPQGIQAHILVIGIDEYLNPKYNLNYAVADASGFQSSLEEGLANITSKTHVYFIKNKEAIRENIMSKLNEVALKANPQDIFIFYYAGHGVVLPGNEQEFFLVPSDVTQLYGDEGAIKQKGIAASELKNIASGIIAQKQLYILDACQSAGALTSLARGAVEEKAIAQLARSTGTHWLTASGSQQFATEFDELGHGVFTYVLLEALSGKADSGDRRVTVNEIKAYLESRVPEISEQYKGSPQYPSSFGFGQDFPVSVKQ